MSQGVYLPQELIQSQAFHALSGTSKEILLHFMLKRQFPKVKIKGKKKRVCANWDRINFAYSEAKKKGFSQTRFTRSLDELLEKGFISVKHAGGAFDKDKAVFELLTEPQAVQRWMSWVPGCVCEARQRDSVTRGFCKRKVR